MLTLPPVKAETEMPPSSALLRELRLMGSHSVRHCSALFCVPVVEQPYSICKPHLDGKEWNVQVT